jgi:hypothetical protein
MRKLFPLKDPAKADQRVIEAIKHDVRKYAKRELRKTPPEGFDLWTLICRVGADEATAVARPYKEVPAAIDAVALTGVDRVYVEILAQPAKWPERPAPTTTPVPTTMPPASPGPTATPVPPTGTP